MLFFSHFQGGRDKGKSIMVGICTEGTDSQIFSGNQMSSRLTKDRAVEHDRKVDRISTP